MTREVLKYQYKQIQDSIAETSREVTKLEYQNMDLQQQLTKHYNQSHNYNLMRTVSANQKTINVRKMELAKLNEMLMEKEKEIFSFDAEQQLENILNLASKL